MYKAMEYKEVDQRTKEKLSAIDEKEVEGDIK